MKTVSYKISLSVAVAGMMLVMADDAVAKSPFQDAVDVIVNASPQVVKARYEALSRQHELRASNMLPDPEVDGAYQWGRNNVGDKWEISVSQSFDWPGVYSSRSKSVNLQTKAMAALVRATEQDTRVEAAQTLIDYVWAKSQSDLSTTMLGQMQALERHYTTAYDHGEATILDVNKVRLARIEASRQNTASLANLNAVRNSIAAMAPGVNADSLLATVQEFPVQPLYTCDQYRDAVLASDPLLQSLDLQHQSALADVSTARQSLIPGFKIGYSHICELGDHFNGLSFGINLPLFSSRHKKAAAQAAVSAAEADYRQQNMALSAEVTSLAEQAHALAREIKQYGSVATDERPVELLRKALDGGEISLLTYLQELAYFNEATANYLELQRGYHSIVARLNKYMAGQ